MSNRSKVAAVAALAGLTVGCSNAADTSSTTGTSTEPFAFPTTSETLSADARQFISPQEVCDALTPEDMAPLTDGEVTDSPTPTTDMGLPGCKWPVQDGYGWLHLGIFKPVSVEALISIAKETYGVGTATMYQSSSVDAGTCFGIVDAPHAPQGYVLNLTLESVPRITSDNPDLCQLSIPQTTKVLERLGW